LRFKHGSIDYHVTFKPRRRQIGLFLKIRDPDTGETILLQHLYILYTSREATIIHDAIHGLRGYEDGKVSFENEKYTYEYDRIRDKALKKSK